MRGHGMMEKWAGGRGATMGCWAARRWARSDGCWVTAVGSRWWWALQCRRWPILNPGPALEEGQGRTLAASCTAEGNPVPTVHWETEVRGANTTRQSQHDHSASVTSEFFVVPGRSMNGKSLTCVVAHPGLRHEKRITHQLSVAYLSDVSVLGHTEEWAEGMEGAALTCLGDGNPPPTYNWTRCGSVPIPTPVPIPVPFPLHLLCTPAAPLCPVPIFLLCPFFVPFSPSLSPRCPHAPCPRPQPHAVSMSSCPCPCHIPLLCPHPHVCVNVLPSTSPCPPSLMSSSCPHIPSLRPCPLSPSTSPIPVTSPHLRPRPLSASPSLPLAVSASPCPCQRPPIHVPVVSHCRPHSPFPSPPNPPRPTRPCRRALPHAVPAEDEVRRVDLVSASVVVVGVIAAVLLCVLVIVVVVMTLYHKRKTKRISEKYEEELTLTRENSIRRLHSSHSTDTRTQLEETLQLRTESRQGSLRGDSLRGDSLRGTSICSAMSEEAEGRSYSTLSTVREIETQTEVPVSPLLSPSLEGKEVKEEEEDGGDNPIKQAMTHFVQENGMLQARPSTNGIYINGRGHLV
ncbi:nectin-4 [Meleagris gallopavo]|uniref:nectin-4 n=1 Tax=Meleagris gallopavo TaxID=9103 RepID=UPI00093CFCC4|nr:nectin-4 [Meleagris gallopavo]